jgi:putative aldouronate transport system substrate-binding protein
MLVQASNLIEFSVNLVEGFSLYGVCKMSKKGLINIVLLLVLITGCAPQITPSPEPQVFSVLYNDKESTPFQESWAILDEYKQRQNVILDVRLGDDADYEKVIIQALESGETPDIILKVWPNQIEGYANADVLLPFSDYEDQLPYFMTYIREHNLQGELDKLRLSDGNYYILPGYQRQIQVQQWIYRRDIFEANDLAIPTTYDELFDSLVILKEKYPDSTPISALWGGAHLFAMMGAGYGIPAGWAGTSYYNAHDDLWQYSPATDNYKELYRFLNRCYEAGILDPAFFTQGDDEFYTKIQDGHVFVSVTWITSGFRNWNDKLKENGIADGEWAPLPVPESTIGLKALPPVDPFRKGLIVPSRVINEPYFADLLKFLDWAIYSEEGRTLTTWGVEGLTYENTADGKAYLPNIKTPKNPDGTIDISKEYGFDMIFNFTENEEFEDYKKPAEIVAFLERSLEAKEAATMNPTLTLDAQSVEVISLISEKLNPYVVKTSSDFITGELDIDKDWDTYIAELESMGYKTVEEVWNDAWKKQNE